MQYKTKFSGHFKDAYSSSIVSLEVKNIQQLLYRIITPQTSLIYTMVGWFGFKFE